MTLHAIYDLSMNPASYDFLAFLAVAEKERIRKGLSSIDVHFQPGESSKFYDKYFPKDESERDGLLWRVCIASCRLLKSVRNVTSYSKRCSISGEHMFPESWAFSRPDTTHGKAYLIGAPRCFTSSDLAKRWVAARYSKYMTITLRECSYGEERNSDRVEWWKVANDIKSLGATPVIVPDTLGHALNDFPNCVEAAWDIDIRCALYEGALLNLGVANGPMSLAILSKSKFIMADETLDLGEFSDGSRVFSRITAQQITPVVEPYWRAAA
jgi:hypothetical protein